jgi:uncharacterized protein (DUF305 family)
MRAAEFAQAMVPHHREAIRMAKAFLAGPDAGDTALRPLAEAILDTQQKEIETLSAWMPAQQRMEPRATGGKLRQYLMKGGRHGSAP